MERKPTMAWVLTDDLTWVLHATARLEPTRELRSLGWDVTLIAAGSGESLQIRGVDVETVALPKVYLIRQLIYHWRVLRRLWAQRDRLDILFCQQISFVWLLPVKMWRTMTGRKRPFLVMDTRDINSADGGLKTELRVQFYSLMHKIANRFADGQTAITPKMAQLVNIPVDKLWGIWPSGVTIETFAGAAQKRSWPQDGESIHLMYIGRLHPERCLAPLCRAVNQANQRGMSFRLSLIGTGPDVPILTDIAAESNGQIQVIPSIDHHEVPVYLANAHIGVTSMPPVGNEKFQASSPIKLFEYLAAGLPTFSTRNACHTDVVDGQSFAFWADDATQGDMMVGLEEIWRQREVLSQLGAAAFAAAQDWSWGAAAQKISTALLDHINLQKEPMVIS